jgi:hypothetical protein
VVWAQPRHRTKAAALIERCADLIGVTSVTCKKLMYDTFDAFWAVEAVRKPHTDLIC